MMMMMRIKVPSSSSFVSISLLLLLLLKTTLLVLAQEVLVHDLELTTEVGKFSSPTDLTFLEEDGGTVWVTSKTGLLQQSHPPYNQRSTILDISQVVCTNGERGLSSVELHPDFDENGYFFIFYPYAKYGNCDEDTEQGPVNRLSRFTYSKDNNNDDEDGVVDIDSEVVYFETPSLGTDHHNGGDIAFGPSDGLMYVTLGDAGDQSTPQDTSNLLGSILRLTADNEIPNDNPFVTNPKAVRCNDYGQSWDVDAPCLELYSWGLRNPFKFSMKPTTSSKKTEFYVNDVGAAQWEEVSLGGTDYAGVNYGWPIREGYCKHGRDCGETCYDEEASSKESYMEPLFAYNHFGNDAAITAGTFVVDTTTSSTSTLSSTSWSSDYHGKYLYADFVSSTIFRLDETGNGCRTCCPIVSNYTAVPLMQYPSADIVVMKFYNNILYILSRGFGGRLHTLHFVGTNTNRAPQAIITTTTTTMTNTTTTTSSSSSSGPVVLAVGESIQLSGKESIDPDEGDTLSYEWDFDQDGIVDSREMEPIVTFDNVGLHTISLKVRDGKGGRTSDTIEIGVGTPPTADILVPEEGHLFHVGESFVLTAAEDDDDSLQMAWEVRQHHSTHYHPYLEWTEGNYVQLQASPSPEDFLASTNSYLEVRLTVTNELGLSTTISRNIMPQLITVHLDSIPSGQTILVDQYEVTTPRTFITWAQHDLQLNAVSSSSADDDNDDLVFQSWSHGAAQSHAIRMPGNSRVEPTFVATFVRTNTDRPSTPSPTTSSPTTSSPTTASPTLRAIRTFSPATLSTAGTTISSILQTPAPTTTAPSTIMEPMTTTTTTTPPTMAPITTTTTIPPTMASPSSSIFVFPPGALRGGEPETSSSSSNTVETMAILFSAMGAVFLTIITCLCCLLVLQKKKQQQQQRDELEEAARTNSSSNEIILPMHHHDANKKNKDNDDVPQSVSFEESTQRSISPMNDDDDEEERTTRFFPDEENPSAAATTTPENPSADTPVVVEEDSNFQPLEEESIAFFTAETGGGEEATTTTTTTATDQKIVVPDATPPTKVQQEKEETTTTMDNHHRASPTLLVPIQTQQQRGEQQEEDGAFTTEIFLDQEEEEEQSKDDKVEEPTTTSFEAGVTTAIENIVLEKDTKEKEFDEDALLEWAHRQLVVPNILSSSSPERATTATTTEDDTIIPKQPTSPTKVRTLASSSMIEEKLSSSAASTPTRTTTTEEEEANVTTTSPVNILSTPARTTTSSTLDSILNEDTINMIPPNTPAPAEMSYNGVVIDETTTAISPKTPTPNEMSFNGIMMDEGDYLSSSSSHSIPSQQQQQQKEIITCVGTPAKEFRALTASFLGNNNNDSNHGGEGEIMMSTSIIGTPAKEFRALTASFLANNDSNVVKSLEWAQQQQQKSSSSSIAVNNLVDTMTPTSSMEEKENVMELATIEKKTKKKQNDEEETPVKEFEPLYEQYFNM